MNSHGVDTFISVRLEWSSRFGGVNDIAHATLALAAGVISHRLSSNVRPANHHA